MKNNIKFGICAYRSNGERVYFVSSEYAENMTPYAVSLAVKFDSKQAAKQKMEKLAVQWVGLTGWAVFQDI
jgi:hypothetical protein